MWRIAAPPLSPQGPDIPDSLSRDERARALSFRKAEDKRRYVHQRLGLRRILASYLASMPAEVGIGAGPYGKPRLMDGAAAARLRFNLSHAGDLAVVAVAAQAELGVDIEPLTAGERQGRLARRIMSPLERQSFERLSPGARPPAFLRCWTRKEAYLKATGEGLSFPPEEISVSIMADDAPRLIRVNGRPEEPARWIVRDLDPADGYVGALVVAAPAVNIRWFDLGDDTVLANSGFSEVGRHHG